MEIHTKDRLRDLFADSIKPIIDQEKLRLRKDSQGGFAKRKFKNGDLWLLNYFVDFRGWRNKSHIGDFGHGVRIDTVEKIFFMFSNPLFDFPSEDSSTIGASWGNGAQDDKLPGITTIEDLEIALNKFSQMFNNQFMPFIKHFHSIENLDAHYNGDYQIIIPIIVHHGGFYNNDDFNNGVINAVKLMRSLIIAKMANNPNYDDIVKVYTHRVSKIDYKTFQTKWVVLLHYLDTQELPEWQRPW